MADAIHYGYCRSSSGCSGFSLARVHESLYLAPKPRLAALGAPATSVVLLAVNEFSNVVCEYDFTPWSYGLHLFLFCLMRSSFLVRTLDRGSTGNSWSNVNNLVLGSPRLAMRLCKPALSVILDSRSTLRCPYWYDANTSGRTPGCVTRALMILSPASGFAVNCVILGVGR